MQTIGLLCFQRLNPPAGADIRHHLRLSVLLIPRKRDEEGVDWLFSFLSADKKKTYCLYEAPSADAIRAAARRANLPADVIIEVSDSRQEMFS
ncbi:nickel-binding protein [Paraburkholderia youngii]|uniref:nickel-binding protein n=1 Tax=Paraburkholderia youngii TaxID=2782701 RepID=UPI0020CC14CF|nr:nickel-binding protein [Paraburkholderia youngii]